jgi:hypothetical protein
MMFSISALGPHSFSARSIEPMKSWALHEVSPWRGKAQIARGNGDHLVTLSLGKVDDQSEAGLAWGEQPRPARAHAVEGSAR